MHLWKGAHGCEAQGCGMERILVAWDHAADVQPVAGREYRTKDTQRPLNKGWISEYLGVINIKFSLWASTMTHLSEHEELRPYAARSCEDELFLVAFRGVQEDKILSMHLESHIGVFSLPLYDFNGKAL